MKRRKFLQLAGGAVITWPLPVLAQQATNLPLVAVLSAATEQIAASRVASIREGLKQAGLTEGRDYALAPRFANGDYARLQELVKELNGLKPRVYVAVGGGITPIHQLAPNTPLVFTSIALDPIASGWAESYARPGGMITGMVQNAVGGWETVLAKLLGYLREVVPNLTRTRDH